MDKLTIRLSNTALGKSGCILNLYRTVIEGYKEPTMPARVIYGIAIHKFLDTMYKTGDVQLAATSAKKAFAIPKTNHDKQPHLSDERHMITTCLNLWATFIEEEATFDILLLNGQPATEQTFSIDYYEDDFIHVFLEGTLDKIGQFKGGCFAIGDWKSTSSWDNNGYFKRYELSRQLRYYTLACKLMAERKPDSTLGRIGATKMGAFIDAIFVKPDANENVVKRSTVYQYTDEDLKAFKFTLDNFIMNLSERICNNHFPKEGILNGTCESKWGLCSFFNVCKSPDAVGEVLLARDFKKVSFEPLNYNDLDHE